MATILAISSQVSFGKVGLSAYQFLLQKMGHEVIILPTTTLATHPALGKPVGEQLNADRMSDMASTLISLRLEEKIDVILSGYIASLDQAKALKWIITQFKSKNDQIQYACDPIMGDNPKGLYIKEEIADYIRDYLAPMADMIAPNPFEKSYLKPLKNKQIIYKSLDGHINQLVEKDKQFEVEYQHQDIHIHGAGDLLFALFVGYQLNGLTSDEALRKATEFLDKCADYMIKNDSVELPIIELQDQL